MAVIFGIKFILTYETFNICFIFNKSLKLCFATDKVLKHPSKPLERVFHEER